MILIQKNDFSFRLFYHFLIFFHLLLFKKFSFDYKLFLYTIDRNFKFGKAKSQMSSDGIIEAIHRNDYDQLKKYRKFQLVYQYDRYVYPFQEALRFSSDIQIFKFLLENGVDLEPCRFDDRHIGSFLTSYFIEVTKRSENCALFLLSHINYQYFRNARILEYFFNTLNLYCETIELPKIILFAVVPLLQMGCQLHQKSFVINDKKLNNFSPQMIDILLYIFQESNGLTYKPRLLQSLCRKVILNSISHDILQLPKSISKLRLPLQLDSYLNFCEITEKTNVFALKT